MAEFRGGWVLYLSAAERALLIKAIAFYVRAAGDVKFYSKHDESEASADALLDKIMNAAKLERGKQGPNE